MEEYRILLLGIGFFGSKWARLIQETPGCRIVGATGTAAEFEALRAQGVRVDFATFEDYKTAIDSVEADIAIVVIPAKLHTDAARRALAKGMHVLSEKPLALDRADALDILAYKKRFPKLHYVVDQNYRWRPHNYSLMRYIQDGVIGTPHMVTVDFRQPEDLTGYRKSLKMPLLEDVSIHHFDLLRYFTGQDCERVYARSYHLPWSSFEGRESSDVLLEMAGGLRVNYRGSWAGRDKPTAWDANFTIAGPQGTLCLDEKGEIWLHRAAAGGPRRLDLLEMDEREMQKCLALLLNSIETGTPHPTRIEENLNSFLMVCAAVESSESGAWASCGKGGAP